jgi:toxin ParE1/3/4
MEGSPLMATFLTSPQARQDLLEIWSFVAQDSPAAANRLLDQIQSAFSILAENPLAGRLREEFSPDLRSFPTGKYVTFYRPDVNGIIVVRVLHGSRDLSDLI